MPKSRPTRLIAIIAIGPLCLLLLCLEAWINLKWNGGGIAGWLAESFQYAPVRKFAIGFTFRILLPVYLIAGLMAWGLTWAPALWLDRPWARDWKGREALGFGFAGLLWAHLIYWWRVPTALWMMPGLRSLPFWIIFPILLLLALAYPLFWLSEQDHSTVKKAGLLGSWLLLWTAFAYLPGYLPRPLPVSRGGDQPCQVLMLGIDGLRSDTFLQEGRGLKGIPYRNSYTPIPATRLLWHILWGGDPLFYTVGHVAPAMEEYEHPHALTLLREAKLKDWKPRFYIDDGGTIGLAERVTDLDDTLMPAEGWENFVNSNLAVSFPLYAAWENWFKPFPTTNPWGSLDNGLKEALRLGRGSKWVMFHSCLAHQPIFLDREELAQTGKWWTLAPIKYRPASTKYDVTLEKGLHPDARTNPFLAYTIRMRSILRAWQPIWNQLGEDPSYKDAVKVLFSDHGERFQNVGPAGFQLQGVHGYNLDPWECRTTMLLAGPGFSTRMEGPRDAGVSLLGLRDGIERMILGKGTFDAAFFESQYTTAPIRYHTLDRSLMADEPAKYRQMDMKALMTDNYIAEKGVWLTVYKQPAADRAKEVSVGEGKGAELWIYKPLVDGGAHVYHYKGYELLELNKIDEETFNAKKHEIEALMKLPQIPEKGFTAPIKVAGPIGPGH